MTAMRPVPDNFVEVFLDRGWDGLQYIFRTHNSTIARWVREAGGDELRARRAAAVQARRQKNKNVPIQAIAPIECRHDPEVIRDAAHFLRHPRNGGWIVAPTNQGDWRVGSMRKSGDDIVAMARNRGFREMELA